MLFDPDCSLEQVGETIDFARQHLDLPWNVCRTEAYSGTPLYSRLQAEGRLQGDYRSYGYRMADARAELMFRILRVCLHERAFAEDSLLNRLISLSFARQLHQHFFPGQATERLSREVLDLVRAAHADTVSILDEARALAGGPRMEPAEISQRAVDMALAAARRALPWYADVDRLWNHFQLRGRALLGQAESTNESGQCPDTA
jgi:hypothetical protein